MRQLLTAIFLLLLFTSCQQKSAENQVNSVASEKRARVQYRIIFLKLNAKREDDYNLYLRDFETAVNQAITEGWQPVGGVTAASMMGVPMQAMIKTE